MTTETTTTACGWRCGDEAPDHKHYAVLVRELNGKLLGRLTPDGTATNRNIYASVFSKARAEDISQQINAAGDFKAKAVKF